MLHVDSHHFFQQAKIVTALFGHRIKRQNIFWKARASVPQSRSQKFWSNAAVESNARGDTVWSARNEYLLRRGEQGLRMARKKVMLSNNDKPLYTLSFLV